MEADGWKAKMVGALAVWLKLLAPGFLDWLAVKVFLEPVLRRARAAQARRGS